MPVHTAPVCLLTLAAWRLGGLTLGELWESYVVLGGSHLRAELAAYLDDAAAWSPMEHNVLAHTINEGLWDLGVPSLAPYRDAEPVTRDAASGTGRPSP